MNLRKRRKMTKKKEERFEAIDQEISGIRAELQKLPAVEEKLSSLAMVKNIEQLSIQSEKQQQQHQLLMKYIEGIVKEKFVITLDTEGSSSRTKTSENKVVEGEAMILELTEESKTSKKKEEEKTSD
ncbi:hypothetical protein E5676_scaffold322G00090 [Cucumis melo var. makuwa]|uniref:Uncharacterized protein n=2 Tax=Cucumis melo TaxID=3656 RepID=A0A5A7T6Q0_CUCMM|nr:hypothetical protein E6C27_scaffold121G00640 [Cucumis melo var. makuwa]TYK26950.1 hypothetical protein E5676_scaffold322G00090 [Cucumis melo var. makuwa]